jgi:predicted N-acetyltransferase YhbS
MRRVFLLALGVVLAGCGGKSRQASELTFEELRDTTGLSRGAPLLRTVEAYRMPNGVLRVRGRLDFPDGTRIEASIYRMDTDEMVSRVQMPIQNQRFESPPIIGPRGPLPRGRYRVRYLALFNEAWQPPEVLEATDAGRRLHGPGITRDQAGRQRLHDGRGTRAVSPARAPRPPALRYRPARRTDVETLAELGMRVWRISSLERRREFFTDHPRFGLRDVRVGELDGQVVASAVLYPLQAFVRGQRVPVTGIGSVGVAPEHRRRGIGEALMRAVLRELRQEGRALSMLYAFRGSYYRKLGYGTAEVIETLSFSPSSLPSSDEARRTRRLMLPDRPAVQALYERVAAQGHFAIERSADWWSRRLWSYPGDWTVYEGRRRGQIEGYLYYEVDSNNGPFKLTLTLSEFVAATPEAHRGLVGHLASFADQVAEIQYASPGDHAWLALLKSPQNLHPGPEIGDPQRHRQRRRRRDAAPHRREARARDAARVAACARRGGARDR